MPGSPSTVPRRTPTWPPVSGSWLYSAEPQFQQQRWYHTIDLGNGEVTPGWFDMRPHVGQYGLPDRMDGMRVLDCGTWDGFWAFEFERRGATVVALDVDHEWEYDSPPRRRPREFP